MSDEDDTPGGQASQNVQARMAQRFGSTAEGSTASGDRQEDESTTEDAGTAEKEVSSENARNAWNAESVKSAWTGLTVYLPDHLREGLDDEYRRLDYELGGEAVNGETLKKDRHFKPLLVALGMERMAGMDRDELMECMERMMRHEFPESSE